MALICKAKIPYLPPFYLNHKLLIHFPWLGASFVGHNPTAAMALLIVAVGCNGFIYAGEQSAMLDIANNFAGTLMGVINALGNTMGFVAPFVVGYIIKGHNDVQHWQVINNLD